MQTVQLQWRGPLSQVEIESDFTPMTPVKDSVYATDKGVYQVSGDHPIYGSNTLLYIGLTITSFKKRLKEHVWKHVHRELAQGEVKYFIGAIVDSDKHTEQGDLDKLIKQCETLLIAAHSPAWNTQGVLEMSRAREIEIGNLHLLNWGNFGSLLPEVSSSRWSFTNYEKLSNKVLGRKEFSP